MGWYDEPYWRSGRGRNPREHGQGWRGQRPAGHDPAETQGAGYGADYRGRGYPYGTGYRPGSEGRFADRAPWTREFGDEYSRTFNYGRDFTEERGGHRHHHRGMSDDDVLESVRENLFQDSYIDPEEIHVRVEDGIVTLTGRVRDYLEARYAWDDAWESPGVRGVINRLDVHDGD